MSQKWVDERNYFGPCRRCGPERFRLRERRRFEGATEPPSLAAALRRLRVLAPNIATEDERLRLLTHLHGAKVLAESLHKHDCAELFEALSKLIGAGASDAVLREAIEAALSHATSAIANVGTEGPYG